MVRYAPEAEVRAFDHVLGDARLRDLKPELEQFAVYAWRVPKRIFDAPDQDAQLRLGWRSLSPWAPLPTPVAAKSGSVPTHKRLRPDDRENLQDCWKPAIQPDKEPAIKVRPKATTPPASQDNQLMSQHRVLSFKPQLRPEWRGRGGQSEAEQPDHRASLGDSNAVSHSDAVFGTHNGLDSRRLCEPGVAGQAS
ncbi:hypothetical protein [Bradyrhizobium sp. Ec3.3]|uniref:hypothetical protein n=1 Tax=Bradyrhizobium sp. Ec3.3 TaxID=189753 RepID=UPI0018DD95B4|nr:hypothetical protein [Bradyrhizobium sp. Ec3.3]